MSGYLRRLAQRTLQSTPAIRSTGRFPYAPLPVISENESILENGSVSPSRSQETIQDILPNPVVMPLGVDALSQSQNKPALEPAKHKSSELAQGDLLVSEQGSTTAQTNYEHETVKGHPQRSGTSIPMQAEISEPGRTPVSVSKLDEFKPLVKSAVQDDKLVNTQTAFKAFNQEIFEPDALSNPLGHPFGVRGRTINSFKQTAQDTNEVHVTIGRIEITALHTQPPSKPVQSSPNKPMSLDEYLAKRNRGQT